ncbi:MAG: endonuclease/exonuclease/phosphatase family protein [Oligoflexus sp.]
MNKILCLALRPALIAVVSFFSTSLFASDLISIGTYNVENLFDTNDDPNKSDETYLPLSQKKSPSHQKKCKKIRGAARQKECLTLDWSEEALAKKIKQLSSVILSMNQGRGPDVLILAEVENQNVLDLLNKELGAAQYRSAVHLDGSDGRGIDSAILSRFEIADKPKLHAIPYAKDRGGVLNSREILQANFHMPDKKRLTVFAVHFPAPYHPIEKRQAAFEHLNKIAAELTADLIIAGGDFNVKAEEDTRLYRHLAAPHWQVSHLHGCDTCIGTHYFAPRDSWSFLDAIMVWRKSPWQIAPESVAVIHGADEAELVARKGGKKGKQDISDHFPLYLEIKR